MEQLTAAHRTLPFGTWVRVYCIDTGGSVDVRINDRGPFVPERIIDLSHAAARRLGIAVRGVARVALQIVSTPLVNVRGIFAVQVGAFRDQENARRTRGLMERAYGTARIVVRHRDTDLWAVLVGELPSETEAEAQATAILKLHHEIEGAFVVRVDKTASPVAD
jgi:rare lipoprotein A